MIFFSGEPSRDSGVGTGALVSFPGVSLPAPLAMSRHCGTGWEGGREASVCLALPPTLRNEGWKLILGKGTDKVSVLGSSCALFPLSGRQLPSLLLPSSRVNTGWREVEELTPDRPVPGPAFGDTPPLLARRVSARPAPYPGPILSGPRTLGPSSHWD